MANSENGDAAAASPRAADADDAISDTHPTAELEVATRVAVTEVELREMRDELKNFIEDNWTKKADSIAIDLKQQNEELRNLYNGAISKIKEIESTITVLQTSAPRGEKSSSWMRIKDLVPEVFSKKEEWKKWRTDVEDYIETIDSGMKAVSKTVAKEKEEIEEAWFDEFLLEGWSKRKNSTNCLKPKPAAKAGRSSSA